MDKLKKISRLAIKIINNQMVLAVTLMILLGAFALRDMPKMIVQGEGFIWLGSAQQKAFWMSMPQSLTHFEVSAVFVGTLLSKFLGLHLNLYYWVWFIVILLINLLLFLMIRTVTKNILIAFGGSLIFAVSYVTQWGMIGWTYTSFLERTVTVIFLIPAFTFLHCYLEKSKIKDLIIAVIFFLLAVWLGQWGLIFAGAFISYPLFWFLFNNEGKKMIIKRVLLSLIFVIISVFFLKLHYLNQSDVGPKYSIGYFLLNQQKFNYAKQVPLQLVRWSQYPVLFKGVITHKPFYRGTPIEYFSDVKGGDEITWQVTIVYLISAAVIFFRLPKLRPFLFAIIFGVISLLTINIYFGRYFPEIQPGPSRYLYLPSIWLSVFWALFLYSIFWQKKSWLNYVGLGLLLIYFLINSLLLSDSFQANMYSKNSTYPATVALFSYIENKVPVFKPKTLILTPWDDLGCGEDEFLHDQIGDGIIFWPDTPGNNCSIPGGLENVIANSERVIKLDYDDSCNCVIETVIK